MSFVEPTGCFSQLPSQLVDVEHPRVLASFLYPCAMSPKRGTKKERRRICRTSDVSGATFNQNGVCCCLLAWQFRNNKQKQRTTSGIIMMMNTKSVIHRRKLYFHYELANTLCVITFNYSRRTKKVLIYSLTYIYIIGEKQLPGHLHLTIFSEFFQNFVGLLLNHQQNLTTKHLKSMRIMCIYMYIYIYTSQDKVDQ